MSNPFHHCQQKEITTRTLRDGVAEQMRDVSSHHLIISTFPASSIPILLSYTTSYRFAHSYKLLFLPFPLTKDPLSFPLPSERRPTMAEATKKHSVRITLTDSGLAPPIYILASFTSPPWEPHKMKCRGVQAQAYDNPTVKEVVYTFWGRFDIDPGVWRYRFRVGSENWLLCNHLAETGKIFRHADSQSKS